MRPSLIRILITLLLLLLLVGWAIFKADLLRVDAVTPVARNEVDFVTEPLRQIRPQPGELPVLEREHLVAR